MALEPVQNVITFAVLNGPAAGKARPAIWLELNLESVNLSYGADPEKRGVHDDELVGFNIPY